MTKTLTVFATHIAQANPSALLAFGVASITAGALTLVGGWGAAWLALITAVRLMSTRPSLIALAAVALLALGTAVTVWAESRR